MSLAVPQTIPSSASRVLLLSGESSLRHMPDWLEDSLALVDTNKLNDIILHCTHQICGICNTLIEDVVLQFLAETDLQPS